MSFRKKRVLRTTTFALLVPITSFLLQGTLATSLYAAERSRATRLRELARNLKVDERMLIDPEGWAKDEARAVEKRRLAAVAALPRQTVPAWYTAEVESIKGQQAIHTLAGLARDLQPGQFREGILSEATTYDWIADAL